MPMSAYMRQLRAKIGNDVVVTIGAMALIEDEAGRFLLIKRGDTGQWGMVGGAVDPLEQPSDAVVREVWEEVGLLVEPTRLVAVFGGPEFHITYPSGDEVSPVTLVFVCQIVGGQLQPDGVEAVDAAYFAPAEALQQLPLPARIKNRVKHVLQIVKQPAAAPLFAPPNWTPPADGVRINGISDHLRGLREKVGHDLLMSCGASAFIFDEQGRVLLQKRGDTGEWGSVGGSSDPDESPANAVVREVWEETGLLVEPVRIVGVYGGPDFHGTFPNGDEIAFISVAFECRVVAGELAADGEESLELAYWPVEKVLADEAIHARYKVRVEHAAAMHRGERQQAFFAPPGWQPPE